jgi:hypothetical protein
MFASRHPWVDRLKGPDVSAIGDLMFVRKNAYRFVSLSGIQEWQRVITSASGLSRGRHLRHSASGVPGATPSRGARYRSCGSMRGL